MRVAKGEYLGAFRVTYGRKRRFYLHTESTETGQLSAELTRKQAKDLASELLLFAFGEVEQ